MPSPENEAALPPIAAAPEGLPDATKATLRTQYAAAGYSADAITAAGYAADPNAVKPVVAGVKDVTPEGAGANTRVLVNSGLSRDQELAGYKHLLANLPASQHAAIVASAKAAGISEADLAYTPPTAQQVEQVRRDVETAGAFAPPENGAGYEIKYDRSFVEALEPAELQAFDVETREAFHAAGVPASMAQGLAEAIIDTGAIYEGMSDTAREIRFKEEGAMFKHVSRDQVEDVRLAQVAYNALTKNYREMLDANYALHSARAQFQLAALGKAIEYRASKTKGK